MRIISGELRSRIIKSVKSRDTRETTDKNRESIFNSIGQYFSGGIALDLFSGSGALGIEAISRGIEYCYFNDIAYNSICTIKDNINSLDISSKTSITKLDYLKCLKQYSNNKFDLVFLDPPYSMNIIKDIIEFISKYKMLSKKGIIVCEYSIDLNLPEVIGKFYQLKKKKKGITFFSIYEME